MKTLHRLIPILFAAAVLGLALPQPGAACSCTAGAGKPCEEYWGTEGHFVGRAVSVEVVEGAKDFWPRRFQFEVLESFIGVEGPTAEVWTGMGGGDCGFEFQIGKSYLIYAGRTRDGRLHTSICSPTRSASRAGDAIAYARQVAAGTAKTSLYGRVQLEQRTESQETDEDGVAGVTVDIEGPRGQRFSVVTQKDGSFEIQGELKGKYTLRAEVPEGLPPVEPQTVEILPGQCAGALLEVPILGTFTGRILGFNGKPLKDVSVSLFEIEDPGEPPSEVDSYPTDSEGLYTLPNYPEGIYLIAVEGDDDLPFFYPGTQDPAQATRFRLRQNETVEVGDFQIPREADDQ